MGADRICLFNKKLADEIVGHDSESIIKFLTTADSEKVKRVFASYPGFHQLHTPEQLASFIRSYIEEEGIGC